MERFNTIKTCYVLQIMATIDVQKYFIFWHKNFAKFFPRHAGILQSTLHFLDIWVFCNMHHTLLLLTEYFQTNVTQAALHISPVNWVFFFSIRVFFHGHWQLTGQQGKGGDHLIPLCHFHPLTNIQTSICNFAREMTITYF